MGPRPERRSLADDRSAARVRRGSADLEPRQRCGRTLAPGGHPRGIDRGSGRERARCTRVGPSRGRAAPGADGLLSRRRLPAGAQADGDLVQARARVRARDARGRAHARHRRPAPRERTRRPRLEARRLRDVIAAAFVPEGPYPFPRAPLDPRQVGQVLRNRGVRLASLGYFGHMWELYAMWAWFLLFFRDGHGASASGAAYATFFAIAIGALGCVFAGFVADRIGRAETAAAAMVLSGLCALAIGPLVDAPSALVLTVGLVWGFAVVADSALFSTLVTEHADQAYVGTALALQLAIGFTLTVATIWLVPVLEDAVGWRWAFAFLAPGPALGVLAMLRLRSSYVEAAAA